MNCWCPAWLDTNLLISKVQSQSPIPSFVGLFFWSIKVVFSGPILLSWHQITFLRLISVVVLWGICLYSYTITSSTASVLKIIDSQLNTTIERSILNSPSFYHEYDKICAGNIMSTRFCRFARSLMGKFEWNSKLIMGAMHRKLPPST